MFMLIVLFFNDFHLATDVLMSANKLIDCKVKVNVKVKGKVNGKVNGVTTAKYYKYSELDYNELLFITTQQRSTN